MSKDLSTEGGISMEFRRDLGKNTAGISSSKQEFFKGYG
jgi:hypothetical protein